MTKETLQENYDNIVNSIRAMLLCQQEYFKCRKLGLQAESQLARSRTAEYQAQQLFKELHTNRPAIIESDIKDMVKEYNHFLDRAKVLLTEQYLWFKNTGDRQQMRKCQALEKEMRERIKKYIERKTNPQLSII